MPKIGVILSGCGVFDGGEIHESVLTLLALSKAGADVVCMAPDTKQTKVTNHISQKDTGEERNVLEESARIARGEIKNIKEVNAGELDAIIIPGGFGAALNLSSFGIDGANCKINPDVEAFLNGIVDAGKPIGALCIAPPFIVKLFQNRGSKGLKVTIGKDENVAKAIEAMGGVHEPHNVEEVAIDEERKVVTGPAYMLANNIAELSKGVDNLVQTVLKMV